MNATALGAVDASLQSVWVRRYDARTNEFVVCPKGSKSEVRVELERSHPKFRDIYAAMSACADGRGSGVKPLRIKIGEITRPARGKGADAEGGKTVRVVEDMEVIESSPTSKRVMTKEGKELGTWTPELDRAVSRHGGMIAYRECLQTLATAEADKSGVLFADVKERSAKILESVCAGAGRTAKDAEAGVAKFSPGSYSEILDGLQQDPGGRTSARVRYDVTRGFGSQGIEIHDREAWLAAATNYSYQRAVAEQYADSCESYASLQPGGPKVPRLALAEADLVRRHALIGGAPHLSSEDQAAASNETGFRVANAVLQGVMAQRGASAASNEVDALGNKEMPSAIIHDQIKSDVEASRRKHIEATSALSAGARPTFDERAAYFGCGNTLLARYEVDAGKAVRAQQIRCLAKGVSLDPEIPNPLEKMVAMATPGLHMAGKAMDGVSQLESVDMGFGH